MNKEPYDPYQGTPQTLGETIALVFCIALPFIVFVVILAAAGGA